MDAQQKLNEQVDTLGKSINQAISDANTTLKLIQGTITAARENLIAYEQHVADTKQSLEAELDKIRSEIKEANDKRSTVIDACLTSEEDLENVNKRLATATQNLKIAEKKQQEFVSYQSRAQAALEAKDKSLQAREEAVKADEQFISNRKSFLPSS